MLSSTMAYKVIIRQRAKTDMRTYVRFFCVCQRPLTRCPDQSIQDECLIANSSCHLPQLTVTYGKGFENDFLIYVLHKPQQLTNGHSS